MTSNPLARRRAEEPPERNVWDHVDMLNGMNWVKASGRPYFVAERKLEGGELQLFVDRAA